MTNVTFLERFGIYTGKRVRVQIIFVKVITIKLMVRSLVRTQISIKLLLLFKKKKPKTAQQVKDAKIETLKVKYRHCEITVMIYLKEISAFIKEWDE
jgi:hypothetical protein